MLLDAKRNTARVNNIMDEMTTLRAELRAGDVTVELGEAITRAAHVEVQGVKTLIQQADLMVRVDADAPALGGDAPKSIGKAKKRIEEDPCTTS